jgi:phage replication O-like protein O
MASPQKENGYTPIANELLDAIMRTPMPDHARRVFICIIRNSYGWHRKEVFLTPSKIAREVNLDVRLIPRAVKRLTDMNMVIRQGYSYQVQKDHATWKTFIRRDEIIISRDETSSSVEMKPFIRRDEDSSSVEMKGTAHLLNDIAGLQAPKERKESIKEKISLSNADASLGLPEREMVCKDLKHYFPTLVVPDAVPTTRAYIFLAKLRFGEIRKDEIRSPPAFLIAMRDEDITPYLEREMQIKARQRAAQGAKPQAPETPADRDAALKFLRSIRHKEVSV